MAGKGQVVFLDTDGKQFLWLSVGKNQRKAAGRSSNSKLWKHERKLLELRMEKRESNLLGAL